MTTIELPSKYSKKEYIEPPKGSHAFCPGCGQILALRQFMKAFGEKAIFITPPSCITIVAYPSISLSYQGKHILRTTSLFGLSGTFAAGLKSALVAKGDTETQVVSWCGDGATFDIGLGLVSGVAERNEDIVYVCADNEGYQNTGNQRSSATPWGATTSTNPLPKPKIESKKDIMQIMMAHNVPYAATASVAYPDDFMRKVEKAKSIKGFRFFHVFTPCPTGWRYRTELTIELARLAVETKIFPLFEIENGSALTINKEPKGIPVGEYTKMQGRFRHLTSEQVTELQKDVDRRWNKLQYMAGYKGDGNS